VNVVVKYVAPARYVALCGGRNGEGATPDDAALRCARKALLPDDVPHIRDSKQYGKETWLFTVEGNF
jgi:hypothetical protein